MAEWPASPQIPEPARERRDSGISGARHRHALSLGRRRTACAIDRLGRTPMVQRIRRRTAPVGPRTPARPRRAESRRIRESRELRRRCCRTRSGGNRVRSTRWHSPQPSATRSARPCCAHTAASISRLPSRSRRCPPCSTARCPPGLHFADEILDPHALLETVTGLGALSVWEIHSHAHDDPFEMGEL